MEELGKTIKPQEIESGNLPAGIGYIAIPDDIDRDKYVEDCYRTYRVTMYGGVQYGFFHNVPVEVDKIQKIKFPKDNKSFGSAVIWVNVPIWNKPAIIGVLKFEDDYYATGEEQHNTTLERNGRQIDISKRADDATIDIHIRGDSNVPGQLNLNIINDNRTCELNINVRGKTTITSSEQITLRSDELLEFSVIDKSGDEKLALTYKNGEGLHYKDEFKNEITFKKDLLDFLSSKNFALKNNNYSLKDLFDDIIDEISRSQVQTALGIMDLLNKAQIILLKEKVKKILE